MQRLVPLLCLACAISASASASTLTLTGAITQSTPDGTGPAFLNPSLNNIADGQAFTLTLNPTTDITGPGIYTLTGSALSFLVASAPASETSFSSIFLSVTANGSSDVFSLLACVSGADCSIGNFLSADFSIPAASIGGSNVAVTGLNQPHPFELLEDDGNTDIQGSIRTFSNTATTTPPAVTPEPASVLLCLTALGALPAFPRTRSAFRSAARSRRSK